MMAVRGAAKGLQDVAGPDVVRHPGYRKALIELAVYVNAAVTAFDCRRERRSSSRQRCELFTGSTILIRCACTPNRTIAIAVRCISPSRSTMPRGTPNSLTISSRHLAERVTWQLTTEAGEKSVC